MNVQFHKKYFYIVLVIAFLAILLLPKEMKAYVLTIFPLITFAPYGFMAAIKRYLLDNYLISNHYGKLKELKIETVMLGYERIGHFEYSHKKNELESISEYVKGEMELLSIYSKNTMLSFISLLSLTTFFIILDKIF